MLILHVQYSIFLWALTSGKKLSVGTKKINNIQNKFKCEIKSENVDVWKCYSENIYLTVSDSNIWFSNIDSLLR